MCIAIDTFTPCLVITPLADPDTHVSLISMPEYKLVLPYIHRLVISGPSGLLEILANVPRLLDYCAEDHFFGGVLDFTNTAHQVFTNPADQVNPTYIDYDEFEDDVSEAPHDPDENQPQDPLVPHCAEHGVVEAARVTVGDHDAARGLTHVPGCALTHAPGHEDPHWHHLGGVDSARVTDGDHDAARGLTHVPGCAPTHAPGITTSTPIGVFFCGYSC